MKEKFYNIDLVLKPKVQKRHNKYYIFDITRKKYVLLTPEEWVRQHFIHFLTNYLNYPLNLIRTEQSFHAIQRKKRTDILIYSSKGTPLIIIECKSASTNLNNQALLQVSTYSSHLKPPYISLTNGKHCYCWKMDYTNMTSRLLNGIPSYTSLKHSHISL